MSRRPSCWFTFSFLILVSLRLVDLSSEEKIPQDVELNDIDSEYDKRQQIAQTYMDSLPRPKGAWIDPHEMITFPVKESKTYTTHHANPPISKPDDKTLPIDTKLNEHEYLEQFTNGAGQICKLDSVYLSRWLKKLLHKIESYPNLETSTLSLKLDSATLKQIKELSSAKSLEITEIDNFISILISLSRITQEKEFQQAFFDSYIFPYLWNIAGAMCVFTALYIVYRCFLRRPILTVVCLIFVVSWFWHWMHLYQQKKAAKHAELSMMLPEQCRKHEFTILQHINDYIKSYFITNQCGKYFEALLVDSIWEVSLTVALTETVTAILVQPLSGASRAVNITVKQLFDGLSLIGIFSLLIFIFLVLVMSFNYKIRFPWFLASLEPPPAVVGSQVENVPIKRLLGDTVKKAISSVQGLFDETLPQLREGEETGFKQVLNSDSNLVQNELEIGGSHIQALQQVSEEKIKDADIETSLDITRFKETDTASSLKTEEKPDSNKIQNHNCDCASSTGSNKLKKHQHRKSSKTFGPPIGHDGYFESDSDCSSDNMEAYGTQKSMPHYNLEDMHADCNICKGSAGKM